MPHLHKKLVFLFVISMLFFKSVCFAPGLEDGEEGSSSDYTEPTEPELVNLPQRCRIVSLRIGLWHKSTTSVLVVYLCLISCLYKLPSLPPLF